jgi:outer membrane protein assembly factor BamB
MSTKGRIAGSLALTSLLLSACLPLEVAITLDDLLQALAARAHSAPSRERIIVAPELTLVWRRNILRPDPYWGSPALVASRGTLALLRPWGVSTFAAADGSHGPSLKYSPLLGLPTAIASSRDHIFLGTNFGYVLAIDPTTRETTWTTLHHWPATVYDLHVSDGYLFAEISPTITNVLDLTSGSSLTDDLPFSAYAWSPSLQTAITDGIYSYSIPDGSRIWETGIRGSVYTPPVFTSTRIAVRAGENEGHVYLLDRLDGRILGVSSSRLVSNLVTDGTRFFGIARSGTLVCWDSQQATEAIIASFGTQPFGAYADRGSHFQIAIDEEGKMIFAYLDDVSELFGFKFEPDGP